jgi:ABC-type transport system involved in multi-copper enzyme maturation permease subunit
MSPTTRTEPAPRAGLAGALRAEAVKLRSVRGTIWAALAVVGLTVLLSAFVCASVDTQGGAGGGGDEDVVMLSLSGIYLSQIAVVALAVTAVTSEYATGTIRTSFIANPRRRTVLSAKAIVVGTVVLAVGVVATTASHLAGQAILPGNGFTAANGYPPHSLADAPTLRAVLGSAVYLALLALLSLGAGTILRHTAAAISAVLGLLFVPLVALTFLPPGLWEPVQRFAPMTAGLAVQSTTGSLELIAGRAARPVGPWAGLGMLAAEAAVVLLAAAWLIGRRDA